MFWRQQSVRVRGRRGAPAESAPGRTAKVAVVRVARLTYVEKLARGQVARQPQQHAQAARRVRRPLVEEDIHTIFAQEQHAGRLAHPRMAGTRTHVAARMLCVWCVSPVVVRRHLGRGVGVPRRGNCGHAERIKTTPRPDCGPAASGRSGHRRARPDCFNAPQFAAPAHRMVPMGKLPVRQEPERPRAGQPAPVAHQTGLAAE